MPVENFIQKIYKTVEHITFANKLFDHGRCFCFLLEYS
jgi:hypothetical protein